MKQELYNVKIEKENLYFFKERITRAIGLCFEIIKTNKSKRDLLSNVVKNLKFERDILDQEKIKLIDQAKDLKSYFPKQFKELSYEISEIGDKCQEIHDKLTSIAAESQICHEILIEHSRLLKSLKPIEKDLYFKCVEIKNKYRSIRDGKQ